MNRELDQYFRDVDREVSAVQEALADRALLARLVCNPDRNNDAKETDLG
jgi:hypothetical protein